MVAPCREPERILPDTSYRFAYVQIFTDYLALRRAAYPIRLLPERARPLLYLVAPGVLFALVWWNSGDTPLSAHLNPTMLVFMVGTSVAALLIELLFGHWANRLRHRVFSRSAIANREASVEIDQAGIRWTIGEMTGAMPWSSVTRTASTATHAFLFISKLEAITLPKRGLQGEDWAGFLDFMADRASTGSSSASRLTESGSH